MCTACQAVGALAVEFSHRGKEEGEEVGVDEVPMEEVELVRGHGPDDPEQVPHWIEVAGRVQEEATVGEERGVPDINPSWYPHLLPTPDQLGEGLQTPDGPPRRDGGEVGNT